MTSGPTQNYGDADLGSWRPHPLLAAVVRVTLMVLPLLLMLGFGLAMAQWLPAARLGVSRWVWIVGEVCLSLVVLSVTTRLAKKLVPLAGLLRLALYFPDRAPSRLAVALGRHSPDSLLATRSSPGIGGRALTEERDHAERLLDMVAAISAHDTLTAGHSERVQAYSALVGAELGLSSQDAAKLSWAALLHDVGKLAVPSEILAKDGRPTDEEWAVLATHPHAGREIAEPLAEWLGPWLDAIDQHHERWDGGGYPAGLAGTEISLAARIVAVVDAYDVITSARSYKAPLTASAARAELARCAGTQFDPEVVRAMLAVGLGKVRAIAGPLSALSALPGLSSSPLSGLASVSSTMASAAAAVGATVLGAALGLAGPGASPSDAATRFSSDGAVVVQQDNSSARATDEGLSDVGASGAGTPEADPEPEASGSSSSPTATATGPSGSGTSTPTASASPGSPAAPPATGDSSGSSAPPPPPTAADPCEWARNGWTPLPSKDLSGCDLREAKLTGNFSKVDLTGADLRGATLVSVDLSGATLTKADLTGATLTGVTLTKANLAEANLSDTRITNSTADGATFEKSLFVDAVVSEASFIGSNLAKVVSTGARFVNVDFIDARVDDTTFTGANVTNCTGL